VEDTDRCGASSSLARLWLRLRLRSLPGSPESCKSINSTFPDRGAHHQSISDDRAKLIISLLANCHPTPSRLLSDASSVLSTPFYFEFRGVRHESSANLLTRGRHASIGGFPSSPTCSGSKRRSMLPRDQGPVPDAAPTSRG
jgi:hypothetical protein